MLIVFDSTPNGADTAQGIGSVFDFTDPAVLQKVSQTGKNLIEVTGDLDLGDGTIEYSIDGKSWDSHGTLSPLGSKAINIFKAQFRINGSGLGASSAIRVIIN